MSVDIKEFVEKYRVRTQRDSCGEEIITSRNRLRHVYAHGDGQQFGILLLLKTKQQWTHAKKQLVGAGFIIKQNGETEGTALFNPEAPGQVKLAFRLARINPKRVMSESQRVALAKARARLPQTIAPEAGFAPNVGQEGLA